MEEREREKGKETVKERRRQQATDGTGRRDNGDKKNGRGILGTNEGGAREEWKKRKRMRQRDGRWEERNI